MMVFCTLIQAEINTDTRITSSTLLMLPHQPSGWEVVVVTSSRSSQGHSAHPPLPLCALVEGLKVLLCSLDDAAKP